MALPNNIAVWFSQFKALMKRQGIDTSKALDSLRLQFYVPKTDEIEGRQTPVVNNFFPTAKMHGEPPEYDNPMPTGLINMHEEADLAKGEEFLGWYLKNVTAIDKMTDEQIEYMYKQSQAGRLVLHDETNYEVQEARIVYTGKDGLPRISQRAEEIPTLESLVEKLTGSESVVQRSQFRNMGIRHVVNVFAGDRPEILKHNEDIVKPFYPAIVAKYFPGVDNAEEMYKAFDDYYYRPLAEPKGKTETEAVEQVLKMNYERMVLNDTHLYPEFYTDPVQAQARLKILASCARVVCSRGNITDDTIAQNHPLATVHPLERALAKHGLSMKAVTAKGRIFADGLPVPDGANPWDIYSNVARAMDDGKTLTFKDPANPERIVTITDDFTGIHINRPVLESEIEAGRAAVNVLVKDDLTALAKIVDSVDDPSADNAVANPREAMEMVLANLVYHKNCESLFTAERLGDKQFRDLKKTQERLNDPDAPHALRKSVGFNRLLRGLSPDEFRSLARDESGMAVEELMNKVNQINKDMSVDALSADRAELNMILNSLELGFDNRVLHPTDAMYMTLAVMVQHQALNEKYPPAVVGEMTEPEYRKYRALFDNTSEAIKLHNSAEFLKLVSGMKLEDFKAIATETDGKHFGEILNRLKANIKEDLPDEIMRIDAIREYGHDFNPTDFGMDIPKEVTDSVLHLSAGRTALSTMAIGLMLKEGFSMDQILDPYHLIKERAEFGKKVMDVFNDRNADPEAYKKFAAETTTLVHKGCKAYINEKMRGVKELSPKLMLDPKLKNLALVSGLYQDSGQELARFKEAAPKLLAEVYGPQFKHEERQQAQAAQRLLGYISTLKTARDLYKAEDRKVDSLAQKIYLKLLGNVACQVKDNIDISAQPNEEFTERFSIADDTLSQTMIKLQMHPGVRDMQDRLALSLKNPKMRQNIAKEIIAGDYMKDAFKISTTFEREQNGNIKEKVNVDLSGLENRLMSQNAVKQPVNPIPGI